MAFCIPFFEFFFLFVKIIGDFSSKLKGVVLDVLELAIKSMVVLCLINMILKHNLFISTIKIKIKFLGLDIEVKSKEKSTPSSQD